MRDLDRKIREALGAEDADMLEKYGEQSIHEMLIDSFRGKSRWLVVMTFAATLVFLALTVFSAVQFFRAASDRQMIVWAVAVAFGLLSIGMIKIWYWMELNKNALTREIKRVELQIARLAARLGRDGE